MKLNTLKHRWTRSARYASIVMPTMASVHKQPGKPYWFCAFSIWNPETLTQQTRVSLHENKRQETGVGNLPGVAQGRAQSAQRQAQRGQRARHHRARCRAMFSWPRTPKRCRARRSNRGAKRGCKRKQSKQAKRRATVTSRSSNTSPAFSVTRTRSATLPRLQASDIARFRDREAKDALTLNRQSQRESAAGLLRRSGRGKDCSPSILRARVKLLKSSRESKRRAFTLSEIKRILRACGEDAEWRGLVLFGLYLGQRLGDLAKLTWRAVES